MFNRSKTLFGISLTYLGMSASLLAVTPSPSEVGEHTILVDTETTSHTGLVTLLDKIPYSATHVREKTEWIDVTKAMARDSRGRYIVVGYSQNAQKRSEMVLWRFLENGELDQSFGEYGSVVFLWNGPGAAGASPSHKWDRATDITIDDEDNYLITGLSMNAYGTSEMTLWRCDSNGQFDSTFGVALQCCVSPSLSSGAITIGAKKSGIAGAPLKEKRDGAKSIVLDKKHRILMAGYGKNPQGGYNLALCRLTRDGLLDRSFGQQGCVHFSAKKFDLRLKYEGDKINELAESVALDDQERIIVLGTTTTNVANFFCLTLWRLTPNGEWDQSFGPYKNGCAPFGLTPEDMKNPVYRSTYPQALKIDQKGYYIAAGASKVTSNSYFDLTIWKFQQNGSVYAPFGADQKGYILLPQVLSHLAIQQSFANDLQIDAQNRYLVAGYQQIPITGREIIIWRFLENGTFDTSFGISGSLTFGDAFPQHIPNSNDEATAFLSEEDRLIVTGTAGNSAGGKELFLWIAPLSGA